MVRSHLTNLLQPLPALGVLAMMLAIAPPAQAARAKQTIAIADQSVCFIELPDKTTALDKLCGRQRNTSNPKGLGNLDVINLDIDANRDGISDQLLEAAQQNLDAQDAAQKKFQADIQRNPNLGTDAINALSAKLGRDFNARMPYSNQVKQLFAEEQRLLEQFSKLPSNLQDVNAIGAKQAQIYQKYSKDPSFIKVEKAQRKVYKEIERRGSAKWLYGTSSSVVPN